MREFENSSASLHSFEKDQPQVSTSSGSNNSSSSNSSNSGSSFFQKEASIKG